MNRLLPAALLSCAAASLSNPAWSFQGFDFFQQIEQSIECVRKPGTDMMICKPKTTDPDPEPEVEPTPPPVVANPNAFDKIEFDEVLAVDPDYDDIWEKADSYDISVDLSDFTHHACQLEDYDSGQFEHNEIDQLYELREIDLNSDSYPDYILNITCRSLNPDIGSHPKYYEFDVYEPFLVMMCGDDTGFYNCTKDITGHDTAFNMSMPGGWPGHGSLNQMIFHDINGDGMRDMIMPQTTDVSGQPLEEDPYFDSGRPELEKSYNYHGYTKSDMQDICAWIWPKQYGADNCFYHRTEQTYALSKDGVWELKKFQSPEGIWNGFGSTQLYYIDGEYHVNWDGQDTGQIRWFRFDQATQEFVFVTFKGRESEYGPTPIDVSNQYTVEEYIVNPESRNMMYKWFRQTGDFETRTTDRDNNLMKLYSGPGCEDYENFDYNTCQVDQLHVYKRDQNGDITKFFEYRPGEWADEILPRQPYEMIEGELTKGVRSWWRQTRVSMYLHGYWVNTSRITKHITGGLVQLEDRPDAPWYFIVSYYGYQDMRNPGAEYQEEFVWRGMNHKPDDRSDHRFYQNNTEIAFKYLVDMDTGELTYAGTVFEHPWIYYGLDGAGPEWWNWRDINGDGYTDPQITSGPFGLAWLSNSQGELQYVDREQSSPLYQYGEVSDIGRVLNYNTWTNFGGDINSDGITDLLMIVNGEELHNQVDNHQSDTATKDLYERDRTYIDIIYGNTEWIPNSPVLDEYELRQRIDSCIDLHNDRNFRIGQSPSTCYQKEIW